ncbi:hypothetical protein [uncultured Nitrospira sp.]|uniref:hypothetical protein n=1 Tax=uncultured Nitrospira sp. TaxID=157176 RepID=UPI00314002B8
MIKEGQGRYLKIAKWFFGECLLFFFTTGQVFANDLHESFDVQAILKQVAGLVEILKESPDKHVLLEELGIVQAKTGYIGNALQSLVKIPDGSLTNFRKNRLTKEIALARAKVGQIDDAIQMATTLPTLEREQALGGIALEKAKSGDVPGALVILNRIETGTNAKEDALKAIGEFQAIKGDLRGGFQTALKAADRYPSALWGIAEEEIKKGQLKGLLSEINGIPLGLTRQYALEGVVLAQISIKDIAGAIEVAKTIPDGHASAKAWQGIAFVQIEAGSIQESLINLKRALRGASATQKSFAKSEVLWGIAACQAKAGDIAGALRTTELVEIVAHKNHALREIAVYQAKAGNVKGALQTASRFRAEIPWPPPYIFILRDLARSGKVKQALEIADSLDSELEDSPYEAIADGQAESGDIEGALETLGKITRKGDRPPYNREMALEKISYIQVQKGHVEEAVRIASLIDETRRSRALKDISLAFVKEGKVDRALKIISSIKEEQSQAELLQEIAYAQAYQGDSQGALKWSKKVTSPFVKSKSLLGVVRGILDAPHRPIKLKMAG